MNLESKVLLFLTVLAILWPYAKTISRAGYSPWWSLLLFVPLVNVISMWIFAYAEWPALKRHPEA